MEQHRKIGLAIRILSHQIGRKIEYQISTNISNDVTGLQGHVLGFIREKSKAGDVFQRDVENEFDIRRSTATGMLKLMEKNGLIKREAVSYDARLKRIVLTDKALGLHNQIISVLKSVENQLAAHLTEDEINTFFSVMEKISDNIK
ncbi:MULTISPECIES: MarR family winged helix-turn-helix transcriptional regulator [Tissierellales]|mgnify:CR=1 FL=1|jgi:DNA-binding MarR family transcriptional regulator|uniref:MarR family transcriptional regulator n=1 Tax=Acidilutibacter cellobiosedens TaxID=2507161 RepID=A0A410QFU5_9FIRM|nr:MULTISPECIES: MarR family winged helix-turn-helix transcriptional regulator [Tissierellales]MBE6082775.1 winged helix-turn-helix transcriptional regulator [Tissierellaceae bacterium]QAT62871.1 MarR family transcriptional regulator [Acidilutibacter cellobiosedens]SCL92928.1 transcriptional regulator SlyA [Sporanaerobacter sp. PP17-6a]